VAQGGLKYCLRASNAAIVDDASNMLLFNYFRTKLELAIICGIYLFRTILRDHDVLLCLEDSAFVNLLTRRQDPRASRLGSIILSVPAVQLSCLLLHILKYPVGHCYLKVGGVPWTSYYYCYSPKSRAIRYIS
jgi:hypothetical protein